MTEQERIDIRLQRHIDQQTARIDRIDTKLDAFIQEMRDKDNQRAAETAAIDNKRSAEIKEIKDELKNLDKYFHNLTLTAMVGVGAAVIGVLVGIGAMAFAVLSK